MDKMVVFIMLWDKVYIVWTDKGEKIEMSLVLLTLTTAMGNIIGLPFKMVNLLRIFY